MYSLRQIIKAIRNPEEIVWEINRLYHRKLRQKSGIHVMSQDWDNLIILDACRYDMFSELNGICGDLTPVVSKGSTTGEFLRKNFCENGYLDTIYISANPQVQNNNIDKKFFERVRLWEKNWHEELRTVHPSDVVSKTLATNEKYPHKRLIIHFIQPHYPFIGEKGRQIEHGSLTGGGAISNSRDDEEIWSKLKSGTVSKNSVWEAYLENLDITLPYVDQLVDELDGKSVVTSDHGNSLGRWGVYGHPGRRYFTELVKVPWLVVENSTRRKINSDQIQKQHHVKSSVEDRLRELGYT
jgi:hypothetical protein